MAPRDANSAIQEVTAPGRGPEPPLVLLVSRPSGAPVKSPKGKMRESAFQACNATLSLGSRGQKSDHVQRKSSWDRHCHWATPTGKRQETASPAYFHSAGNAELSRVPLWAKGEEHRVYMQERQIRRPAAHAFTTSGDHSLLQRRVCPLQATFFRSPFLEKLVDAGKLPTGMERPPRQFLRNFVHPKSRREIQ